MFKCVRVHALVNLCASPMGVCVCVRVCAVCILRRTTCRLSGIQPYLSLFVAAVVRRFVRCVCVRVCVCVCLCVRVCVCVGVRSSHIQVSVSHCVSCFA